MTNEELYALTAIVNFEASQWQYEASRYGEAQWDPMTPSRIALAAELERRGIFGGRAPSTPEGSTE